MTTRYSLASVFMGELLIAANLSSYWSLSRTWQNYGFYILSPVLMILLNLLGVFVSIVSCMRRSGWDLLTTI